MNEIEWSRVDLNLLAVLDVLLAERSVTRAAQRLGRTPSAVSHSLARCRELFGDPLLVRDGRRMLATPRAEEVQGRIRSVLADVHDLVEGTGPFDPTRSSRTFSFAAPDLLAPALPDLIAAVRAEAPFAAVQARAPLQDPALELSRGAADLGAGPLPDAGAGLLSRRLGTLTSCVLARRGHPAGKKLTRETWLRYPHIVVETGNASPSVVGLAIARAGLSRRVGLVVPSFLVAPQVVASTDLLFTAPREVILPLARQLDLQVLEPPVKIPPIPAALLWAERVDHDPGHRWFRELVARVLRPLLQRS